MKKRVLSLLLVATMIFACIGCGNKEGNEQQDEQQDDQQDVNQGDSNNGEETPSDDEPQETVTIKFVRYGWGVNEDEQQVVDAINAYIEPKIGVKIETTNIAATDIYLETTSGGDVDLFWFASWHKGDDIINAQAAMDLTDLLPQYEDLYASIPENVWEACQREGVNWFVPVYKEMAEGWAYAIRKDVLEASGLTADDIKSYKDLEPVLAAAADMGIKYPLHMQQSYNASYQWNIADMPNTSDFYVYEDGSDEVFMWQMTDEYEEELNWVYEMAQKGYISEDFLDHDYTQKIEEHYKNGEAAMSVWQDMPDSAATASNRYGHEMEIINISGFQMTKNSVFGSAYGINAKSEKADACLKFLELLYTDSVVADLLCYGIEGEHYNLTDEGRVELIADSGFTAEGVWATTNVKAPTLMVGESADKGAQYDEFNIQAVKSSMDSLEYTMPEDIAAIKTAVQAAVEEYSQSLSLGLVDPKTELPKMRQAMKDAGYDQLMEYYQGVYDEWKNNQ